ncbi:helix-turn-helix domain-containing protein [Flavobacteriaceae bacterium S356]|uniref:Helix-turn-helix domain-containing protein n=1 Tax=Asprobacillus argus TaxID=3076534 RepID=A0ABU3LFE0_9FLAO|nr:helix-turn-helix domain-containing protein [Flavobacteriaceae bacterium S356]
MDIWSILIIVLLFQGVFNLSVLSLSYIKKRQRKDLYLILITLTLVWFLLEFLSVRNTFKVPLNLFYGTRYGSWLLLGPLAYFFFKSATNSTWRFKYIDSIHLLPFIFFALIIPWVSSESLSHRQIHYGMLAVFDYRPKTVGMFEYVYSTIFYIQFIHLAVYLLFNLKLLTNYAKNLQKEYSSINDLKWLRIFNIILICILILSSAYLYILFISDAYSRSLDYIYVVPIGLFIYAISYKLYNHTWLEVKMQKRYQSSSLKEDEKETYIQVLENIMQEQHPYLKNDLRIKDLSSIVNINQHHLSQLINEHYTCSFFDFINRYRVEKAKEIMVGGSEKNLLQIAFESGFNNKTSFINAFKKFNGTTPSHFRKGLLR